MAIEGHLQMIQAVISVNDGRILTPYRQWRIPAVVR
jgi:hypothetical protein